MNTLTKSAARFIIGESTGVKIKGTPDKIKVTKNVILASKSLYEELNSDEPNLDRVLELMKRKNSCAADFRDATGLMWLL